MKNNAAILIAAILVTISHCNHCRADSEDVNLTKIVVTPSRIDEPQDKTSSKVDVITSKDILTSSSNDISQTLNDLPGINVNDYGSVGAMKTVHMRGSTAAQVLVMVDGRPANSPRDGEADLGMIPLDMIDRIEIVHGPGSSLYGSSAMGGTINILTKDPPKEGQKTELFSSFGTFRTYAERASHGGRIDNFGYLLNSGYEYSQGIRQNSNLDARDANGKLEYALNNENTVRFNGGTYQSKTGSPGTLSSPDVDDRQDTVKNFGDLSWVFAPRDLFTVEARTYVNNERLEFLENTAGSLWDTANKKDVHATSARGVNTKISGNYSDSLRGAYGFDYLSNGNDSTSSGKHKYSVRAGYMEHLWTIKDGINVNFGGRIDNYSNFGTKTNPSAGIRYDFNDKVSVRGAVARSFRAPTFNDLYWPDEGWTKGNPLLKPEKGQSHEAGVDLRLFKPLSSSVTVFRNEFSDLINWSEEASVWTPKNVNKARIDGIELNNTYTVLENLDANAQYSYLKPRDKFTHKDLVYQPRNKLNAGLKYHDINGFACQISWMYTGTRYEDAGNTVKVKHFDVYNLDFSKKVNTHVNCYVSFKNLLNRKYRVMRDYPAPGFSCTGGIKTTF
jgi:outer membrane cobalamin receptor